MNSLLRMSAALLLGSLLLPSAAIAQSPEDTRRTAYRKFLKAVDKNRDGKIGRSEYLAIWTRKERGEADFRSIDLNGDGFITEREFVKATAP